MGVYWLIVGTLAVWRLTHLFAAEDGPWDAMARLRRRAAPTFWGGVLDCFYCLSLWIAAPVAGLIGQSWTERGLLWLALSGGAILLERTTSHDRPAPPAVYEEDAEHEDGMLRRE